MSVKINGLIVEPSIYISNYIYTAPNWFQRVFLRKKPEKVLNGGCYLMGDKIICSHAMYHKLEKHFSRS